MNDINISIMNFDDLELIKNSLNSDFDDFWNYEVLKSELSSSTSKYIVAKNQDNNIVGFAGIKIIFDTAELMNIVTKKNERNSGIANSMLNYIINYCKQANLSQINLEVNSKNSIAINLYKKYNFNEVGFRKKYYDNKDDAILMSLEIK